MNRISLVFIVVLIHAPFACASDSEQDLKERDQKRLTVGDDNFYISTNQKVSTTYTESREQSFGSFSYKHEASKKKKESVYSGQQSFDSNIFSSECSKNNEYSIDKKLEQNDQEDTDSIQKIDSLNFMKCQANQSIREKRRQSMYIKPINLEKNNQATTALLPSKPTKNNSMNIKDTKYINKKKDTIENTQNMIKLELKKRKSIIKSEEDLEGSQELALLSQSKTEYKINESLQKKVIRKLCRRHESMYSKKNMGDLGDISPLLLSKSYKIIKLN